MQNAPMEKRTPPENIPWPADQDVTRKAEYSNTTGPLETLQYYCIALEDMIELAKRFIKSQQELKSLRQVRRQLSICQKQPSISDAPMPSGSERYAIIEDNVPDELKCPVCFEIFGEEVFQCLNGHSICSPCCNTLSECPECRKAYNDGKVRNRTVEALMGTLKIDCIYNDAGCKEKMACVEMQTHVETCSYMNKPVRSPEYKEVRRQIRTTDGDTKRMEKLMEEYNKRVIRTKALWENSRNNNTSAVESLEWAVKEFRLTERETEMTELYVDLTQIITP